MIEHLLTPLISGRFLTEPRYREGHIRIINALPKRKILGVHVPDMKRLAKQLSKSSDVMKLLQEFKACHAVDPFSLTYEEIVIWGLVIDSVKVSWEVRKSLLSDYIPVIDNWGVCDTFCCNAKWVKDKQQLWDFLLPYWDSCSEFEVRFAVVMAMVNLLDAEWFPKICLKLDSLKIDSIQSEYISLRKARGMVVPEGKGVAIGEEPYYVRMAIAWLLATALAKIPDFTRAYVNSCSLSEDIIRLYKRKARESLRTRDVNPL